MAASPGPAAAGVRLPVFSSSDSPAVCVSVNYRETGVTSSIT